jgi:hypothetical protein
MPYELTGNFVECCDCFTVCPCWVSDLPDEDHCSGLYLWAFGPGSHIDGVDLAGIQVAAASFHAVRAGGQAMFFIDAGIAGAGTERLIYDAFSGKLGGLQIDGLHKLLGVYLGYHPATIAAIFAKKTFKVTIDVNGQRIAAADGADRMFDGQADSMTLRDTALSDKLGVGGGAVLVQRMGALTLDVAALPGGPLNFSGRWGARSVFRYAHVGRTPVEDAPGQQDADEEG